MYESARVTFATVHFSFATANLIASFRVVCFPLRVLICLLLNRGGPSFVAGPPLKIEPGMNSH